MLQKPSHDPHTKPPGQKAEVAAIKTSARPVPALATSAFPRLPGGTALSMSPIHKPGLMTQMPHMSKPGHTPLISHTTHMPLQTQTPLLAAHPPKYAKIQPAIAIKPRPLAVAPAPAAAVKSTFNPRYTPTKPVLLLLLLLQAAPDADLSAINTLRKWVLPPRPRPGRKPTSGPVSSDDERKPLALASHKKQKQQKRTDRGRSPNLSSALPSDTLTSKSPALTFEKGTTPTLLLPPLLVPSTPGSQRGSSISQKGGPKTNPGSNAAKNAGPAPAPSTPLTHIKSRPGSVSSPHAAAPLIAKEKPNNPAPARVTELQKIYLAKLKEQELVQNYIDILGNQIKELKFVQSGVITFDALNSNRNENPFSGPNSSKSRNSLSLPSDQLDHINNVRDLDAFLAHLTTQSNVIHSATKKFVGDSLKDGSHVQLQLKNYLEMKAAKTGARAAQKSSVGREFSPYKSNGDSGFGNLEMSNVNFGMDGPSAAGSKPLSPNAEDPEAPGDSKASSFFTSGFLRPLNVGSLEQDAGTLSVDIINERDPFSGSVGLSDKKRSDSMAEEDMEMLARSLEFKQQQASKAVKKLGCGFCSGETPCLCFDADLLLTEK